MKTIIKRTVALLLAACVVLAGMGNLAGTAYAAEANGSYVLQYDDEGQPYLYGSLYECKHSYNDPAAGPNSVWTFWNAPEIFNLVYEGDNGTSSIAAYCTDADTSTISGDSIYYRRINLEDSTYHDLGAAERLRAVVLHSFPYLTVEAVTENVNQAMGADSVRQLTQGEVISATQQAIWEITHGEKYNVDKNYVSIRSTSGYDRSQFVYPESLDACVESEFTAANIERLYQYFLKRQERSLTLSFAEMEAILGFTLPKSAYTYPMWWNPSATHTQSLSWTNAGYRAVNVSEGIRAKRMTFEKVHL